MTIKAAFYFYLHGVGPPLQQLTDDGSDLLGQWVVQLWQGVLNTKSRFKFNKGFVSETCASK